MSCDLDAVLQQANGELSIREILLYLYIDSIASNSKDKQCWKTDEEIAQGMYLKSIKPKSVNRMIKRLTTTGFINRMHYCSDTEHPRAGQRSLVPTYLDDSEWYQEYLRGEIPFRGEIP